MPRPFSPKIVAAHALVEGHEVYLTADDRWSHHMVEAEVITDEAHAQLRLLQAEGQTDEVIGAWLAEVEPAPRGPGQAHLREPSGLRGASN